jgi:tRNA dimethylallyltransferase
MAAKRSEAEPLIIVILGCTGTGKSKLSLEIGKRIGGEIISADSMQVYKGLDIITNKVTAEERASVPHHLLDFVKANQKFSVVEFKTIASDAISDILARQKVPIIVGGTNYYIESLLWENLIDEKKGIRDESAENRSKFLKVESEERRGTVPAREPSTNNARTEEGDSALSLKSENEKRKERGDTTAIESQHSFHEQLAKIDSTMAQKLHPNDTRKIKRSLQVYEQSGVTHTEHIAQQQSQEGASEYGGPMRYKNVCVLWIRCEFETLDKRLDARVDQMLEQGLVNELTEFHNSWKRESSNSKIEQNNEGIFQSIGFKEFGEFLNLGNTKVEESPDLFQKCVEAMKCATRRYARKQVRWVKNRFLGRPSTSSPDVYSLDATDLGRWGHNVLEKALTIVESFRSEQKVPHAPLERVLTSAGGKHSNHKCTVCNGRVIIGDQNWEAHLRSRSHRHYKKKQRRLQEEVRE